MKRNVIFFGGLYHSLLVASEVYIEPKKILWYDVFLWKIQLTEEILQHLGCIYKTLWKWDIDWCRISSINKQYCHIHDPLVFLVEDLLGWWQDWQDDSDNHQDSTSEKVNDQEQILRRCMGVEQEG